MNTIQNNYDNCLLEHDQKSIKNDNEYIQCKLILYNKVALLWPWTFFYMLYNQSSQL